MKSLHFFSWLVVVALCGELAAAGHDVPATEKPPPVVALGVESFSDLTGPWQLFVDDYLIDSKSRLTRSYHPFQKHDGNPVNYKSNNIGRGTVLPGPDAKGYRRWMNANSMITSADGLNWTRSVRLERGSRESRGNISVIHTPWDVGREYKMIATGHEPAQKQKGDPLNNGGGRYGAYSSDGIHWAELSNDPLFLDRSDTGLFVWDQHRRRYFGTPKIWTHVRGFQRRCVGFSASENFKSGWPTAQLILVPDEFDDRWVSKPGQRTEFYSLSAFAYESMYLGLLEVFRNTDGWKDGPIFIELVTSRDGLRWERTAGNREPCLPNGPSGSWDAGMIKVPNHPLVEGDRIRLFYYGSNQTHGFARQEYETFGMENRRERGLGLATLRKDGFASLDAGPMVGTLTTKVLKNPSGALVVNYKANGGWLKVELLDAAGKSLPGYRLDECFPVQGDNTNQAITWKERKALPRRPLRLRFQLENASLYSFAAGPDLKVDSVTPELAMLYTFEGDRSTAATDRLQQDGAQAVSFHNAVLIDDNRSRAGRSEAAAFGKSEVMFLPQNSQHALKRIGETAYEGKGAVPWTYLEIDGTFHLGEQFTLAAFVKPKSEGKMRLFSSWEPYPIRVNEAPYHREGAAGMKELLFDIDSGGGSNFGCMRLIVHGQEVRAKGNFDDGDYHHLVATYDNGAVKLFLDGKQVGVGAVPGGAISLLTNLHVGGDPGPLTNRSRGQTQTDQLVGLIDDLLVLGRVLTAEQISQLCNDEERARTIYGTCRE